MAHITVIRTSNGKPVNAEGWERWVKKLQQKDQVTELMFRIPPMLKFQMEAALANYHGGYFRAAMSLLGTWWLFFYTGLKCGLIWWFSDRMGWTKLRPVEKDSPLKMRHRASCDYLNCQDGMCMYRDHPRWFNWLISKIDE